eukprot:2319431-Rhodomonas_salina.1
MQGLRWPLASHSAARSGQNLVLLCMAAMVLVVLPKLVPCPSSFPPGRSDPELLGEEAACWIRIAALLGLVAVSSAMGPKSQPRGSSRAASAALIVVLPPPLPLLATVRSPSL